MISKTKKKDVYRVKEGLTPAIVEQISKEKKDPQWMQLFRLESLQIYNQLQVPNWGPSIEGLNMDEIVTYVRPNTHMSAEMVRCTKGYQKIPLSVWESLRQSENLLPV